MKAHTARQQYLILNATELEELLEWIRSHSDDAVTLEFDLAQTGTYAPIECDELRCLAKRCVNVGAELDLAVQARFLGRPESDATITASRSIGRG